ncbi:nuclear transport factor 2 family protein [Bacillus sp. S/N-304-OC-R1]|uniref:nuclear transport factor 2 family protein n=1 Tax=Bacillus sp. S/N-304-OC-R1 TaxID=2758034 RepID=UPI001C8ED075|nr:nuclear transport factor 2 family protein [Bacillus sp. S/N-304-OC-R1]MBY0122035.1 nuclear transport factor 2 family protein [Bacillus sp. S/N-304-OC-R1]
MEQINEVLKDYFKSWNEAFITKDGERIKSYMSKDFRGYWAHSGLEEPDQYDYHYDLNGVLEQYDQAEKSFVLASISMRKNGEEFVAIGTETALINDVEFPATCMLVWRKEEDEWKLLREYIELEK